MKVFNTTAVCIPSKHYMVDISERVREIKKLVDEGKYFTINRARQYGKTTTLYALTKALQSEYVVLSLDFQAIGHAGFQSEEIFVKTFSRLLLRQEKKLMLPDSIHNTLQGFVDRSERCAALDELFFCLSDWCALSEKPVVLMIDEIDSASNNQVFLDFLAQLRYGYIRRDTDEMPAFHSVILAGVTDIKHLKSKIRDEDQAKVNSPWNIAADFNIDMSLSEGGICRMLEEYEADHHTGMDTPAIARLLHDYTSGYPFLVSRLCQLVDTEVSKTTALSDAWTLTGLEEAIKLILTESNTLFQSITAKLTNYPELKAKLHAVLMKGEQVTYSADQDDIAEMQMYGFIRKKNGKVIVSNRIFETRLYNLFLSDEELKNNSFSREGSRAGNIFVKDGNLDVPLILERFIATYEQVCGPLRDHFAEKDGRELFLLYLKPIINGTGNYYIEAQTRDYRRTDVIIDYLGKQYIIELKIWHGERYNAEGEQQIIDYLDYYGLDAGYMLSFNFNQKKETGVKKVSIGGKTLYEATL